MKGNQLLTTATLALGLAFGLSQLTPSLRAQSQAPQQTPPAQQAAPPSQQAPPAAQPPATPGQDDQKPQVVTGKVVKAKDGRYALLTDEQSGKGVFLDDQEKAKSFEGKTVKVTGVLDPGKNMVHVSDIQPAQQ